MSSSSQSTNALQRFIRFPVTKLMIGIFMVLVSVLVTQLVVTTLPFSELITNILLGVFTLPVVYWVYYAFVHYIEKRDLKELDFTGSLKELGSGTLTGFLLFSGTIGVLALFGAYKVVGTNPLSVIIIPLIGAVVSGFFEEVLFRGILFHIIEESLGSWWSLVISGVIFGLLHLLNKNATLVGAISIAFEAGILLAAAYMFTRRLWFAIGIHFAWNFTQAGIFGIAVSGNEALSGILKSSLTGPNWLTGGEFGAEASIVAVVLCVSAGIYLIIRSIQKGNIVVPYWKK